MDTSGFAAVALGVILFACVSRRLENSILTPPMVFTLFGLSLGGAGLGIIDVNFSHSFVHGLAEVTLVLVLFSDAARIDLKSLHKDHSLPTRMLLIGLPLTIVAGAFVGWLMPLGLQFWEAALLAAVLAPTDAALGQSVVSSPAVPVRIRQTLNVESGLNDGIALPVVLLFASLVGAEHAGGDGGGAWLLFGVKQIVLGPLAGVVIGLAGSRLLDAAAGAGWIAESYEGGAVLGTAFLAYATSELIGGNGFIAAFVSGMVFGNVVRGRCKFVFEFAEAEGQLLVLLTFLVFGAAILPDGLGAWNGTILLFTALSLTVIRMVPVAISLRGAGLQSPTIAFLGWFGPRGLASILFALFVLEEVASHAAQTILAITIVTVAVSILAHGLTAAPLAGWYGRAVKKLGDCEEIKPVREMPTRVGLTVRHQASTTS